MSEEVRVAVEGRLAVGEVAIVVAPGTKAKKRDALLDVLLAAPLYDAASELGVVLAAAPSSYAFPLPGKDEAGRTRFAVRGRIEGDRLVPHRPPP